ncbi:MAG TPA: hypothetical protein VIF62_08285, partial [Labilithrix sp.]
TARAAIAAATCTAAAIASFACGTTSDGASVRCGPGTVETNLECVPAPPSDAANDDAPADDAAPEAATDAPIDVDAGPPVHDGDTCTQSGCYANHIYACSYASVDASAGTVVFEQFGDCSLLGGTCTVGAPIPACKGGGYTPCNPADAGTHCASSDLFVMCDTEGRGTWIAASCAATGSGNVCVSSAEGAGCGPP